MGNATISTNIQPIVDNSTVSKDALDANILYGIDADLLNKNNIESAKKKNSQKGWVDKAERLSQSEFLKTL